MRKIFKMKEEEKMLWARVQILPENERMAVLKDVIWTAPRPAIDEEAIYMVEPSEVPEAAWRIFKMAQAYGYAEKSRTRHGELETEHLQIDGSLMELLLDAIKQLLEVFLDKGPRRSTAAKSSDGGAGTSEHLQPGRRCPRLIEHDSPGR